MNTNYKLWEGRRLVLTGPWRAIAAYLFLNTTLTGGAIADLRERVDASPLALEYAGMTIQGG